ncbi:unnamed protein product [Didymodactylos carnosus]|uniref:G-protein coupled receptors family 1 profile domain-containing protein n=1 Tax=Didymodactylos carnosus TaxID=1234261 RepID=A0A814N528_9BILA|nr:unnamed protein product [Didymodactylos carnosus]CAF1087952.1 unnamed protein product [Didymodactylos carnosus]CAF3589593.1 unnamed protein product [Didymodactylos carnosus]CAF3853464.1 unnamed protein product [Didymodactylos carnosus]
MKRFSCSFYFVFLAIFDQTALLAWTINRLTRELTNVELRNRNDILCKLYLLLFYYSAQAAIWMLVLATFDRLYFSVKISRRTFLFGGKSLLNRRSYLTLSLPVVLIALLCSNAVLVGSSIQHFPDTEETVCLIINEKINSAYAVIDFCVYAIVPSLCMLTGDSIILWIIRKSRARVHVNVNGSNHYQYDIHLSLVLVAISVIFLIIATPYSILVLMSNFRLFHPDETTMLIYQTAYDLAGFLSCFTHAMHFYLFVLISKSIRKQFTLLVLPFIRYLSVANVRRRLTLQNKPSSIISSIQIRQI